MRFGIEFSADAEHDFDLIFDHLFESYVAFGEGTEEALDHAAQRVMDIRKAASRLASFPLSTPFSRLITHSHGMKRSLRCFSR